MNDHPPSTMSYPGEPLPAAHAVLPAAARVDVSDRFALLDLHAVGGIGQVWLARDVCLDRDVALKELRPEWLTDAAVRTRFVQEARITGRLEHPGIVPIYALGQRADNEQPFYAMRFVRGRTLSQAVAAYHQKRDEEQAEPRELLQLLNAFVAACNTVDYAHARGVIHRDLKGPNVILGDFGEVVVVDWGMAKMLGLADLPATMPGVDAATHSGDDSSNSTQPGQTLGTPAYMSPEQAAGHLEVCDRRTDVYGLGTILYEILTGRPPFTAPSLPELLRRVIAECPVRPRVISPAIPATLETICLRALAKNPDDRHQSARELAEDTQTWLAEFAETPLKRMAASEHQAREALRKARDQQRALIELIRTQALRSPNLGKTLRHITEVAARTSGVERVSIWRFTRDRSAIRCVDLYERSADRHSSGLELEAKAFPEYFRALESSEVIAADDAVRDVRTSEFANDYLRVLGIGSMLDAPIHRTGRLEGVLCQEHVGAPREWTAEEQLFGIALSNVVSLAIESRRRGRGR